MPLVNTPMLNYTIEFLASSGMTSIYVLACSHADMIEEHVQYVMLRVVVDARAAGAA